MGQKSSWQKVLYQKLGKQWYVFTEMDGEINYSILPIGVHPHAVKRQLITVEKRNQHNEREPMTDLIAPMY